LEWNIHGCEYICSQNYINMKIKYSDFVVDGSGSILGTTYAKNKGGAYRKAKSMPTNPQTPRQSNVRVVFASLSQGWKGLTEAQRAAWNTAAPSFPVIDSLGVSRIQSGFALYIRLNTPLAVFGTGAQVLPPEAAPVIPQTVTTLTISAATVVNFVTSALTQNSDTQFYATAPMSPGIYNFKNKLKRIAVANAGDSDNDVESFINAGIASIFGPLTGKAGSMMGFAYQSQNAGGEQAPFVYMRLIII